MNGLKDQGVGFRIEPLDTSRCESPERTTPGVGQQ